MGKGQCARVVCVRCAIDNVSFCRAGSRKVSTRLCTHVDGGQRGWKLTRLLSPLLRPWSSLLSRRSRRRYGARAEGGPGRGDPRNPIFWGPWENSLSVPAPHSQLSKDPSAAMAPGWESFQPRLLRSQAKGLNLSPLSVILFKQNHPFF